jgi:hypothetical protein
MFQSAPQSSSPNFPAFLSDVFLLTAQVDSQRELRILQRIQNIELLSKT